MKFYKTLFETYDYFPNFTFYRKIKILCMSSYIKKYIHTLITGFMGIFKHLSTSRREPELIKYSCSSLKFNMNKQIYLNKYSLRWA